MIQLVEILILVFALQFSAVSKAETVYVTDQLQIGLHADKTLGSPILKVVSSGTPLELIKTEDELSFVRDPDGTGGWIDNSYISPTSSANVLLRDAEERIRILEQSLTELQNNPPGPGLNNPLQSNDEVVSLQQQLQEERQRSTELLSRIDGLNNQTGRVENVDSLYEKIEHLSVENRQLTTQLADIIENTSPVQAELISNKFASDWVNTKNIIISISILLFLGLLIGIYIMDLINRRRHGGFRV